MYICMHVWSTRYSNLKSTELHGFKVVVESDNMIDMVMMMSGWCFGGW